MEELVRKYLVCPHCHADLRVTGQQLVCQGCGKQYLSKDDVPELVERTQAADFDYLTHYQTDAEVFDYFEERTGATEHSERRLREVITSFVPKDARTILDVGCGSAWVAKTFLPRGTTVISLDASTVNPGKALKLYPSKDHYGVAADAFHLPFRDSSIDCVVAAEIIEHVPDPKAFVTELFRVLAPGGKLIVSTPYKETIRYELCIHCNKMTPVNAHLHSFDEHKLAQLNPNARFRFRTFNNKLLLFARSYVLLRHFPLTGWLGADSVANALFPKPVNIVVSYTKRTT